MEDNINSDIAERPTSPILVPTHTHTTQIPIYIIHSTENIDPIVKDYKPDNIYTFILRW